MAVKKRSSADSADELIAEMSRAGSGPALRNALRKMLRRKGVKTSATVLLRNFQHLTETLAQYGFKFSETFGAELRFAQLNLPEHTVSLAPQPDRSVGWSRFSPSGATYGTGLRSLRQMLVRCYGRIDRRGIAYRAGRRVILAGPSTLE